MSILHRNPAAVQPEPQPASLWPAWTDADRYEPADDTFTPFDGDEAWFAEVSAADAEETAAGRDDLSDRVWLCDQRAYHAARADREAFDVQGMLACVLDALQRSMRFQRCDSAGDFARKTGVDLVSLGSGPRRSALARALDAEAAWYDHLDTDAGRLAASEIRRAADLAERMGSDSAEDFVADEAAWRAAAIDAVTTS